jgi:hypothetical protein
MALIALARENTSFLRSAWNTIKDPQTLVSASLAAGPAAVAYGLGKLGVNPQWNTTPMFAAGVLSLAGGMMATWANKPVANNLTSFAAGCVAAAAASVPSVGGALLNFSFMSAMTAKVTGQKWLERTVGTSAGIVAAVAIGSASVSGAPTPTTPGQQAPAAPAATAAPGPAQ